MSTLHHLPRPLCFCCVWCLSLISAHRTCTLRWPLSCLVGNKTSCITRGILPKTRFSPVQYSTRPVLYPPPASFTRWKERQQTGPSERLVQRKYEQSVRQAQIRIQQIPRLLQDPVAAHKERPFGYCCVRYQSTVALRNQLRRLLWPPTSSFVATRRPPEHRGRKSIRPLSTTGFRHAEHHAVFT